MSDVKRVQLNAVIFTDFSGVVWNLFFRAIIFLCPCRSGFYCSCNRWQVFLMIHSIINVHRMTIKSPRVTRNHRRLTDLFSPLNFRSSEVDNMIIAIICFGLVLRYQVENA
jgi:hypothetical protein